MASVWIVAGLAFGAAFGAVAVAADAVAPAAPAGEAVAADDAAGAEGAAQPVADGIPSGGEVAPDAADEAAAVTAPSGAVAVTEAFNGELIELLRASDSLDHAGRVDRLSPALSGNFDLDFMAAKVLGRRWKALSPEEQARWREGFTQLMTANYAGRFVGWADQSFTTLDEQEAGHGTVLVRTRLHVPGEEEDVALDYRLREVDGSWRIIDVFLNGTVSELALRRSEYSSVLKRDGFEALIASVQRKRDELAAAP